MSSPGNDHFCNRYFAIKLQHNPVIAQWASIPAIIIVFIFCLLCYGGMYQYKQKNVVQYFLNALSNFC